jgi:protease-4
VISEFKEKKKISVSVSASCNQAEYILASAFTEVALHPVGILNRFNGSTTTIFMNKFLKDYFGFLVIKTQRHEYKEFGDWAARNSISEPVRENKLSLLSSVYDTFFQLIVEDRQSILPESISKILFGGPYTPEKAKALGLIDTSQYSFDVIDKIKSEYKSSHGNTDLIVMDIADYVRVHKNYQKTMFQYHKKEQAKLRVKTHDVECISYIHIGGPITSNSREKFIHRLDRINKDHNITSVILRVDSPGGDAIDSNTLYAFIDRLRVEGKKKVIVSMGNIAASGGYYVALSGDRIFAHKSTITGSIGVVSIYPHFDQNFLNKHGITTQQLRLKDAPEQDDLFHYAKDRTSTNIHMDFIYEEFLKRVAESRELPMDKVEQLARGKIYTGQQAFENGLVDEVGGLVEAIDYARTDRHTGIRKPYVISFYEQPMREVVTAYFSRRFNPWFGAVGINEQDLQTLKSLQESPCLLLYVPDDISDAQLWSQMLHNE